MPGIIATGVVRYSLNGTYAGRPWTNIVDALVVESLGGGTRAECLEDLGKRLIDSWVANVLENVVSQVSFTDLQWLDLDSESGSTGTLTAGTVSVLPQAGTAAGDGMAGNVAYRVNRNIVATRGKRKGRLYLVGVSEADTAAGSPNQISTAKRDAMNADLAILRTDMIQDPGVNPLAYGSHMVVLHTEGAENPDPPPAIILTATGTSEITSLTTDLTLATQRRRLRG